MLQAAQALTLLIHCGPRRSKGGRRDRSRCPSHSVDLGSAASLLAFALVVMMWTEPCQINRLLSRIMIAMAAAAGISFVVWLLRPKGRDDISWLAGWASLLYPKPAGSPTTPPADGDPPAGGPGAHHANEEDPAKTPGPGASVKNKTPHPILYSLLVPAATGVVIVAVQLSMEEPGPPYDRMLYIERAVNLANGVSPLAPCLLLGLAAVAWLLSQLRRIDDVHSLWGDRIAKGWKSPYRLRIDKSKVVAPASAIRKRKKRLTDASERVSELLVPTLPMKVLARPACLLALSLTGITGLRLLERYVPTADGNTFSRVMIPTIGFLELMVTLSLCRLLVTWSRLRRLLREIALLPMQKAFDRLPKALSREFGPYLNSMRPTLENREISVRQWALVADAWDREIICHALGMAPPDNEKVKQDKQAKEFAEDLARIIHSRIE